MALAHFIFILLYLYAATEDPRWLTAIKITQQSNNKFKMPYKLEYEIVNDAALCVLRGSNISVYLMHTPNRIWLISAGSS